MPCRLDWQNGIHPRSSANLRRDHDQGIRCVSFVSKVGAKIILGYFIVIILMTVIGELALFRLDEISATVFNLTDRMAGDWALSNEVANRIVLARLYANQYVSSHQQTALDQFRAELTAVQDLLARFDAPGIDPVRRDRFAPIHADVNAYDTAFEQAAALIMDQDEVQSQVLDVKGLVIDNRLAALRIGLNALNDPSAFLVVEAMRRMPFSRCA